MTQAGHEIRRRHDQFLTLQNDRRLGKFPTPRKENLATAFTQRAQDLKNQVSSARRKHRTNASKTTFQYQTPGLKVLSVDRRDPRKITGIVGNVCPQMTTFCVGNTLYHRIYPGKNLFHTFQVYLC